MDNPWLLNIVLGLLQGITEFLPVSSSGHLAVANFFLTGGLSITMTAEIALHAATLLAVLFYFRGSILNDVKFNFKTTALNVSIATLCTGVVAFPLKGLAEFALGDMKTVAACFAVTGLVLLSTLRVGGENRITPFKAAIVGFVQGFAVMPGLSRSGLTIAAALLGGVKPEEAFRFSFYIFIPAVVGATILEIKAPSQPFISGPVVTGFFVAMVGGFLSLLLLQRLTVQRKMWYFSIYLLFLAGLILWHV